MRLRKSWQRMGSALFRFGCLGALLVCLGGFYRGPVSQAAVEGLTPTAWAMYYGWPSLVNGAKGNTAAAAAVFGQYSVVVFGERIEEVRHEDHAKTAEIIAILHRDYQTRVFGYMDATSWSESSTMWQEHVTLWDDMGVDGVFVDRFGYDWGVTRAIQNQILDTIHGRDLRAFVNSWHIDNTFSSRADPKFPSANPSAIPSHISATDLYMLESFVISEGNYAPCELTDGDSWLKKADKAFAYRRTFGTTMWAATTADQLTQALEPGLGVDAVQDVDPRLSYAWYASALYGLDGFSWVEPHFSATGSSTNLLPWRSRPAPNSGGGVGTAFREDVQHVGYTHSRRTDLGQYRVVCRTYNTYTAEFVVNPTPTPTQTPTLTPNPPPTLIPSSTPTPTLTLTPTPSMTLTPTSTPTATSASTRTPTATPRADADSDNDGMPDVYETQYTCLSPIVNDMNENPDSDSYRNIQEYRLRTDPCTCNPSYDWNGDGEVSVSDVLAMVPRWGETSASSAWIPEMDVDGDGVITVTDFIAVINQIGARCD